MLASVEQIKNRGCDDLGFVSDFQEQKMLCHGKPGVIHGLTVIKRGLEIGGSRKIRLLRACIQSILACAA